MVSENRRIAKNTVALYFRMLFVMAVAFFSTRIVLKVLGAEDYGLYNVVGGFVLMLSFLNGAASGATSRYLSFYLGRNELERYQQAFSAAFQTHLGLAVLIALVAETVGVWFLLNKLTIAPNRIDTALWVFHLSVLSCFVTFTQVPYNASIISHERMDVYAYVGVAEALMKLGVLWLLAASPFDKLKSYAFLLFAVSTSIAFFYRWYCRRNFPTECTISRVSDKAMFHKLINYAGWDTLGSITGIAQTQGINVLLNLFFTTVVNAARGIAYQVDAAVTVFITNFLTAINPQVVKAYARNDIERMDKLILFSGKYAFLLFSCMAVPIIIETPFVLHFWLGSPPEHTIAFLRLVLLNHFISTLCVVINTGVHATGDVRRLNIYAGTISIMKLPVGYILLRFGLAPEWVFIGILPLSLVCLLADIKVLCWNVPFSGRRFLRTTLFKNLMLIALPCAAAYLVSCAFAESLSRVVAVTLTYLATIAFTIRFFGMTTGEKLRFTNYTREMLSRIRIKLA